VDRREAVVAVVAGAAAQVSSTGAGGVSKVRRRLAAVGTVLPQPPNCNWTMTACRSW